MSSSADGEAIDPSTTPSGEYGDAPDDQPTFYRADGAAAMGSFPSLYATENCRVDGDGTGANAAASELFLGAGASSEAGIRDPDDEDGTANEIDDDLFDDGLVEVWALESGALGLKILTGNSGAATTGYLNVLADLNVDGEWAPADGAEEWVVQNYEVSLEAGESLLVEIDDIAAPATPFRPGCESHSLTP